MKMGWCLNGDDFPKKWRNAYEQAWQLFAVTVGTDTVRPGLTESEELDMFRWVAKFAAKIYKSDMTKIRAGASPEVFEEPMRSIAEMGQILKGQVK